MAQEVYFWFQKEPTVFHQPYILQTSQSKARDGAS